MSLSWLVYSLCLLRSWCWSMALGQPICLEAKKSAKRREDYIYIWTETYIIGFLYICRKHITIWPYTRTTTHSRTHTICTQTRTTWTQHIYIITTLHRFTAQCSSCQVDPLLAAHNILKHWQALRIPGPGPLSSSALHICVRWWTSAGVAPLWGWRPNLEQLVLPLCVGLQSGWCGVRVAGVAQGAWERYWWRCQILEMCRSLFWVLLFWHLQQVLRPRLRLWTRPRRGNFLRGLPANWCMPKTW